jgi:molybdopterin converting factor small subunit
MAKIDVFFVGPWRMYTGTSHFTIEAETLEDAIIKIEASYGHKYHERLAKAGIFEKRPICGDSNLLLNRIHIRQLESNSLKDGDMLQVIPRFVGG